MPFECSVPPRPERAPDPRSWMDRRLWANQIGLWELSFAPLGEQKALLTAMSFLQPQLTFICLEILKICSQSSGDAFESTDNVWVPLSQLHRFSTYRYIWVILVSSHSSEEIILTKHHLWTFIPIDFPVLSSQYLKSGLLIYFAWSVWLSWTHSCVAQLEPEQQQLLLSALSKSGVISLPNAVTP